MAAEQRPPSAPLLVVEDLHVAYGKAEVVHGVSFAIRDGEFAVMLGRNGAGKSTIMHAISGLIPKVQGRVRFDGQDISASSPAEIVKLGLVQVLQGHRVITSLSVEDNLLLGMLEQIGAAVESVRQPHADQQFPGAGAQLALIPPHGRQQESSRKEAGLRIAPAAEHGVVEDAERAE